MNIRALPSRLNSSSVAIIGIAGVVLIWIALLAASEGFKRVLEGAGSPDVVIIMRDNSAAESTSRLSSEEIFVITRADDLLRDEKGALASPELFITVDAPLFGSGQIVGAAMRGISARGAELRPGFHIVKGRMFAPEMQEVIVGTEAAQQYAGLDVGRRVRLGREDWLVAGHFADRGSVAESEIWTDVAVLQGLNNTRGSVHSVRAKLAPRASAHSLQERLDQESAVGTEVVDERTYYADQSRPVTNVIDRAGRMVTFIMALGAIFGAVNAMYAAVASRTREIATLRAIGFGSRPIVVSVICEAMVLGLIGGTIGSVVALVGIDGLRFSTASTLTNTQVGFEFAVTAGMVAQGVVYALALGLIGGFLPCIRAARLTVAASLRP
jgi:putative ABC transport system permease protein